MAQPDVEIRPAELMGKVCASCLFWQPYVSDMGYGECGRIGEGLEGAPDAAIVCRDGGATLTTRATFGCTLHEEQR